LANILLLKNRLGNATVTVCHSRTPDLKSVTRTAEILIVAIGRPKFITGEFVSDGCIVLDVGTNVIDGNLVGDVDFASVEPKASAITPVPGGIGPVTVSCSIRNVLKAYQIQAAGK